MQLVRCLGSNERPREALFIGIRAYFSIRSDYLLLVSNRYVFVMDNLCPNFYPLNLECLDQTSLILCFDFL